MKEEFENYEIEDVNGIADLEVVGSSIGGNGNARSSTSEGGLCALKRRRMEEVFVEI